MGMYDDVWGCVKAYRQYIHNLDEGMNINEHQIFSCKTRVQPKGVDLCKRQ